MIQAKRSFVKCGDWFTRISHFELGAVHMSRASPANRADSILSPVMGAEIRRRTKIKRHSCLKQHESLPSG